jgi:hypothetical protein
MFKTYTLISIKLRVIYFCRLLIRKVQYKHKASDKLWKVSEDTVLYKTDAFDSSHLK